MMALSSGVTDLLLSMTGHGQATASNQQARAVVEVRTVNNRFLKININGELEPQQQSQLETLVKKQVGRGSINLRVRTELLNREQDFAINQDALRSYMQQVSAAVDGQPVDVAAVLQLPGVVQENCSADVAETIWPVVQEAAEKALKNLHEMRAREGQVMLDDLSGNCDIIESIAAKIETLAPRVIDNYSKKITDRINQMLEKFEVTIEPTDVVREVGVFAERVDISEEIVRLGSHIKQFREILASNKSNGRKLDFLTQELLRETNTIGSKANDAEIASHVVEVKTAIERIREMDQNVE